MGTMLNFTCGLRPWAWGAQFLRGLGFSATAVGHGRHRGCHRCRGRTRGPGNEGLVPQQGPSTVSVSAT